MVIGLPQIHYSSHVCEQCVVGKQHRLSFPTGTAWRAKEALTFIHTDLCGLINPSSNGNKRHSEANVCVDTRGCRNSMERCNLVGQVFTSSVSKRWLIREP